MTDKYTVRTRNEIEYMLRGFNISESDVLMISAILTDHYSMIRRKQK